MGMMLSGGMGEQLAHWIATGAPSIDLFSYDPGRFHASCTADAGWVKDRTHESYAKTYAIVFPSDEALAGRGSRRSALYDSLAQRGCVFQARHGYERPGWFAGSSATGTSALPKPYDYCECLPAASPKHLVRGQRNGGGAGPYSGDLLEGGAGRGGYVRARGRRRVQRGGQWLAAGRGLRRCREPRKPHIQRADRG
eukprot:COSAG01_NODE_3695_length_5785_cov_2.832601_2_plen_196_part_00